MHARYEELARNRANHVPLTPLSFLKRASVVYGERPACSYGAMTRTWAELAHRCGTVAEWLRAAGVGLGDTVSVIAPNLPHVFELHFAVPLSSGVLKRMRRPRPMHFGTDGSGAETLQSVIPAGTCRSGTG